MKGKIVKEHKNKDGDNPYGFDIEVKENGQTKTYYAHIGDLEENENLLYSNQSTQFLKEGEEVEFEPWEPNRDRAIHVKKV